MYYVGIQVTPIRMQRIREADEQEYRKNMQVRILGVFLSRSFPPGWRKTVAIDVAVKFVCVLAYSLLSSAHLTLNIQSHIVRS